MLKSNQIMSIEQMQKECKSSCEKFFGITSSSKVDAQKHQQTKESKAHHQITIDELQKDCQASFNNFFGEFFK